VSFGKLSSAIHERDDRSLVGRDAVKIAHGRVYKASCLGKTSTMPTSRFKISVAIIEM
jgi:hypothetical protein